MQLRRWVRKFQEKRKGIRFSWPWKPPLPRLILLDYWWRTDGINVFNDRLFEAIREKKKKEEEEEEEEEEGQQQQQEKTTGVVRDDACITEGRGRNICGSGSVRG